MLNQFGDVDRVLAALADPTRRWIVEQLGRGPSSVSTLAAPLPMSLAAVVQHLQVLERSGLVVSKKQGRVRTCRLDPERLDAVEDWIAERRRTWDRRLDRLGAFLDAQGAEATPSPAATPTAATQPPSKEGTP